MTICKDVVYLSRVVILIFIFGLNINPALSQLEESGSPDDIRSGGVSRPSTLPLAAPTPGERPSSPIDIKLKEKKSVEKKETYGANFYLKEIKITGNTAFSVDELKKITSPYEGRFIYNSELEDVRIALTRKYIDRGYINSGAVIPDHKVLNGVVHIKIIEGELTDIEIVGNKHIDSNFIKERLKVGAATPLNVNDLQEQIQILLESPSIETINSALRPGDNRGEANLTALVKEGPRFQLKPVIDNRISPSLGNTRKLLPMQINNLTGMTDTLNLSIGKSDGLDDANLNWNFPTIEETSLTILASYSDSKVVKGSFKELNVVNKAQTVGFRVNHPFYRTAKKKFSMSLGLDSRENNSGLLGVGFSFTAGVPSDGKVKETVIRFSQDWTERGLTDVIAARSVFSHGIDALDATINEDNLPSGEFFAWLGQFQWAKLLGGDRGQLIFRTNVQYTNDPLFGMEQFSIGGALSVRGYLENKIVRDRGYDISLEYRSPLMKDASGRSILTLAPFVDAGGSSNTKQSDGSDPNFIYSAGFGIRWNPIKEVHAQIYWGHPFVDVVNSSESLQDDGFHFLINADLTEWF